MESDNLNADGIIHKEYLLKNENLIKGYNEFYKHTRFRRNSTFTILFSVFILIFAVSIISEPDSYMAYVLIIICLIQIAAMWLLPKSIVKQFKKALSEADEETYIFDLYEDKIVFSTKETEENEGYLPEKTVAQLENDNIAVIETDEIYEIILDKKVFYVLPLNLFTTEEMQNMDNVFENTCGLHRKNRKV
jgi:hypothetical protein